MNNPIPFPTASRAPASVDDLTPAQAQAIRNYAALHGVSLTDAVRAFLSDRDRVLDDSAAEIAGLHPVHLGQFRGQAPQLSFRESVDAYLAGLLPKHRLARLVVVGVLGFGSGVAIAAVVKAVWP